MWILKLKTKLYIAGAFIVGMLALLYKAYIAGGKRVKTEALEERVKYDKKKNDTLADDTDIDKLHKANKLK